ncbi:hypothetical protein [[Clostridium] innocuum]|uniref:hypothetical protein n=1 Tax=Clostridium innocuum TaxID=1522 RepID=UPI00216B205A|nr:hypothetical protein [[Clostridium] innocuum]
MKQKASSENKQQKETPQKDQNIEKTNQTACGQSISEASAYAASAVRYIKAINTGSSTDIYYERLDKIKDILSESMYKKLSPEMSKEELEAAKEQTEKVDKDSITETRITDTQYSYRWKDEGKYEVSVIYTQRVTRGDFSNQERYLCRIEVTKKEERYIITNIYEDSALSDGLY